MSILILEKNGAVYLKHLILNKQKAAMLVNTVTTWAIAPKASLHHHTNECFLVLLCFFFDELIYTFQHTTWILLLPMIVLMFADKLDAITAMKSLT